jgi:hypothetical protein
MKYLFCMILLSAGSILRAQDQYPSPEYNNYPYFFNKSTKQLVALEKTSATITTKAKALGYGGVSSQYVIEGNASTVKIPGADTTEFIVTGGNAMMDPSQMLSLYPLDASKRQRSAVMMQGKGLLGKNKEAGKISLLVKKNNDRYVLVVPVKLEPGEYAFINIVGGGGMNQTFEAFCFSVK